MTIHDCRRKKHKLVELFTSVVCETCEQPSEWCVIDLGVYNPGVRYVYHVANPRLTERFRHIDIRINTSAWCKDFAEDDFKRYTADVSQIFTLYVVSDTPEQIAAIEQYSTVYGVFK